jgi:hypothetical protein
MGWDWVRLVLRPLFGLLYQPQMIDDDWEAIGGMRIGRGNWRTPRKPVHILLRKCIRHPLWVRVIDISRHPLYHKPTLRKYWKTATPSGARKMWRRLGYYKEIRVWITASNGGIIHFYNWVMLLHCCKVKTSHRNLYLMVQHVTIWKCAAYETNFKQERAQFERSYAGKFMTCYKRLRLNKILKMKYEVESLLGSRSA